MSDAQEYKDGDNPDNNVVYTPDTPGGDPSPEDAQRIKDVGGETHSPDTPATQLEKAVVGHTRGVDPSEIQHTRPPDLSERPEGPTRTAPEETVPGQPPTPEGEFGFPESGPPAPPAPGTQP